MKKTHSFSSDEFLQLRKEALQEELGCTETARAVSLFIDDEALDVIDSNETLLCLEDNDGHRNLNSNMGRSVNNENTNETELECLRLNVEMLKSELELHDNKKKRLQISLSIQPKNSNEYEEQIQTLYNLEKELARLESCLLEALKPILKKQRARIPLNKIEIDLLEKYKTASYLSLIEEEHESIATNIQMLEKEYEVFASITNMTHEDRSALKRIWDELSKAYELLNNAKKNAAEVLAKFCIYISEKQQKGFILSVDETSFVQCIARKHLLENSKKITTEHKKNFMLFGIQIHHQRSNDDLMINRLKSCMSLIGYYQNHPIPKPIPDSVISIITDILREYSAINRLQKQKSKGPQSQRYLMDVIRCIYQGSASSGLGEMLQAAQELHQSDTIYFNLNKLFALIEENLIDLFFKYPPASSDLRTGLSDFASALLDNVKRIRLSYFSDEEINKINALATSIENLKLEHATSTAVANCHDRFRK